MHIVGAAFNRKYSGADQGFSKGGLESGVNLEEKGQL